MIKYAITGNIASGKSILEKQLEKNGFVVFDTDLMTHDILTDRAEVALAFKEYDVFEYGRLSREKLGKLVFSDKELKNKLESIVHPLILEELEQIFKVYSEEKAIFISVPLLFEVGWEKLFDKIVLVKADDDIRLQRLIKRNNYSEEYAKTRLNSQMGQEIKVAKADFIIENNSSKESFLKSINTFIKSIS